MLSCQASISEDLPLRLSVTEIKIVIFDKGIRYFLGVHIIRTPCITGFRVCFKDDKKFIFVFS